MIKVLEEKDFENFETRYRINFFNSIIGFRSLNLIGTKNKNGDCNLAIFSSIFHMGSNPAYFGILFRPSGDVPRHTLSNILETGSFTLNHVSSKIYKQAHQTSAKYETNQSEFEACDIDKEFKNNFFAPFVKDSPIQLGLNFERSYDMEFNNTQLIVGKVVSAFIDEKFISKDGFVDLTKSETMAGVGLDGYATVEKISRLSHAKVYRQVEEIE